MTKEQFNEIKKDFFKSANEIMFKHIERSLFA